MKTSKIALLLFLLLILTLSGCIGSTKTKPPSTSGPTKSYSYGLAVTDFSSQKEVDSGDTADISLTLQNVGNSKATNIVSEIYQTSGFTGALTNNVGTLLPPDAELGLPGETTTVFWTLTAPSVQNDQIKSLVGRITYDYASSATTNIYLVGAKTYNELGPGSFHTYSTNSVGPVSIKITPTPPFKVSSDTTSKTVHIDLLIENTGTGHVINDEVRNFAIKVTGAHNIPASSINCENVGTDKTVKLFGAEQARSVKCTLSDLPFDGGSSSYIVSVTANYTYYIDTPPLNIKVMKSTSETSSGGSSGGGSGGGGGGGSGKPTFQ